jgi:hypothetical protein
VTYPLHVRAREAYSACNSIEPRGVTTSRKLKSQQTSWSRGAKDEKGEAAYLFRVSFFSVNRYAKMVPSIVN